MTLISVHGSQGLESRCDAKCHDASTPAHECECCCGGMNHGVGAKQALQNTREHAEEMLSTYVKLKNILDGKTEVNQEIFQLSIF